MVVLGVDLRASPKRPSVVVALNSQSRVTFLDRFSDDDEVVHMAQTQRPELIVIGAPMGLPDGLCCLEATCNCQCAIPQRKGRQSELELSRMGISCFFTNKGSIICNLIYRSIALSRRLSGLGLEVVEAYPHATKVILFGDKVPPRNNSASLTFLKERLSPLILGLTSHLDALDRNSCDAVLNAYTGLLHTQDATDTLGTPKEGTLILPKLPC